MKMQDLKKHLATLPQQSEKPAEEMIEGGLLDAVSGAKMIIPPIWGQWNMAF